MRTWNNTCQQRRETVWTNHKQQDQYEVDISEAQADGQKGKATTDHLLILKDLIKDAQNKRKTSYVAFLDATKAYDKAWLDGIMYAMHKRGLQNTHWQVVRNLNQNLKAQLLTKHGLTEEFDIRDSIRQGGVLSVLQYALLMDEISKEINKEKKGKTWKAWRNQEAAYYGWVTYYWYQRTPQNYRTC